MNLNLEKSLLPELAFSTLKSIGTSFENNKNTFSEEDVEILHSFFGENLLLASELLEKCKVIEYRTENDFRNIYKIITNKEQYTIYNKINFCCCESFRLQVLELGNALTCKHVLAVQLAQITGQVVREIVSNSMFVDFLDEQINDPEDGGPAQ